MSYRPITDVWILARPKVPYYGAYPSGFLSRARELLGVHILEPVLHVCGGKVRDYPFKGRGPNDRTIDLDPACAPDFLMDARRLGTEPGDLFPLRQLDGTCDVVDAGGSVWDGIIKRDAANVLWPAALIDRPYSTDDAARYVPGSVVFPESLSQLLKRTLLCVRFGGRVGVLDYLWPRPPKWARLVACIGVVVGYDNRMRVYSVFERELVLPKQEKRAAENEEIDDEETEDELNAALAMDQERETLLPDLARPAPDPKEDF